MKYIYPFIMNKRGVTIILQQKHFTGQSGDSKEEENNTTGPSYRCTEVVDVILTSRLTHSTPKYCVVTFSQYSLHLTGLLNTLNTLFIPLPMTDPENFPFNFFICLLI